LSKVALISIGGFVVLWATYLGLILIEGLPSETFDLLSLIVFSFGMTVIYSFLILVFIIMPLYLLFFTVKKLRNIKIEN